MRSGIFQTKVEEAPDNMLFRFSLGQALYEEGQVEASIPHLEKCVAAREDWMLPRILLGKARLEIADTAAAKAVLSEALALAIAQNHEGPEAELRALLGD